MNAQVGVIMGSKSDWDVMASAVETLESFKVPVEVRVLSAHRTPDALLEWASTAEARGLEVIIAAAGGAAHLAGVTAAKSTLPVVRVPMDSLLSTVQMPGGIPVATFAIGKPGAVNAGLFAVAILAVKDARLREALKRYRENQSRKVLEVGDPRGGARTA
jgi:5-(carboxyamino)imidazole ribonucleotide mutase